MLLQFVQNNHTTAGDSCLTRATSGMSLAPSLSPNSV